MKKIYLFILACASCYMAAAQTKQEQLNTGKDASYMGDFEKDLLYEINLIRSDPANYLKNNFAQEISEAKAKVEKGEKKIQSVYQTSGGKTDTLRYDENVVKLHMFENLQHELEKNGKLPPFVPNEKFQRLTASKEGSDLSGKDSAGFHIDKKFGEFSTTSVWSFYKNFMTDMLYSESTDVVEADVLHQILTPDTTKILAVHFVEHTSLSEKYPAHFYVSIGERIKKIFLLYKKPIEGYENQADQFVDAFDDGLLIAGANTVTKLSNDDKIVWRWKPTEKGDYEIDSYVRLQNGNVMVGGWNKTAGKNHLWLVTLNPAGKTVWEKSIPVKDGTVLALIEDNDHKGFSAIVSEYKSKKVLSQSFRRFDYEGIEKQKQLLTLGENATARFNQDVSLYQVEPEKYIALGTTEFNSYEGVIFRTGENGDQNVVSFGIEGEVIDRTYSNFVTVPNPAGGFYVAYEADNQDGRMQDYRLEAIDEGGQTLWTKDLGGDLSDGVSSMVIDKSGNLILAGYSYSGVSGDKSEPAFEKDHCDAWVIKVNSAGDKIWDKTITGPGCILQARLFQKGNKIGLVYKEEEHTMIALMEER